MRTRLPLRLLLLATAFALSVAPVAIAQDAAAPMVAFAGEFAQPLRIDAAALKTLPRRRVEALDHGEPGTWEGVAMVDLLRKAGAPLDDALRGKALAHYVEIGAADGYRAVFALAEFDPAFGASGAILADSRDGKPLDAHEGPFRIVVPEEKRQGRWVRQVTGIALRSAGK